MEPTETMKKPGNSDTITRRYYDSLLIQMRLLDSALSTTAITLFGERLDTPIMTAAVSRLNQTCENGFAKMAQGVKAVHSIMWMGIGEDEELETIIGTGARAIKIIKPYADNDMVFRQMEHARACGALAVGMDIDHCFTKDGAYSHTRENDTLRPKTTEDIRQFVKAAGIPFIVKGVLSVEDACKSVEAGAGAIVVSHHHAIMDFAVPPAMLLPQIAEAVGGEIPIIVDSGIASGVDAFKALALGAAAVCVGRSLLPPLIKEGAAGVEAALQRMTGELAGMLARTGSIDPHHIDPSVIVYQG